MTLETQPVPQTISALMEMALADHAGLDRAVCFPESETLCVYDNGACYCCLMGAVLVQHNLTSIAHQVYKAPEPWGDLLGIIDQVREGDLQEAFSCWNSLDHTNFKYDVEVDCQDSLGWGGWEGWEKVLPKLQRRIEFLKTLEEQ